MRDTDGPPAGSGAIGARGAAPAATSTLRANHRLVRYTLAKFLQLLAQNSLVYGLFILIIRKEDSSLVTSAFVLTAILPSVVLSLPGGVVADALPKKGVILTTLLLRTAIAALFLQNETGVALIILLTSLTWTVYQFYSPAESAALPAIVASGQLAKATALLHATSLLAQVSGAGLLAPVALKLFGEDGLFSIVVLLLAASTLLFAVTPGLTPRMSGRAARRGWISALPAGVRAIKASDILLRATIVRVLVDAGFVVLVVAAPKLVHDVLRTAPENTVYIALPGAAGIAFGLFFAPLLAQIVSARVILWTGFVLAVAVMAALAFIPEVAQFLDERAFLPLREVQDRLGVRREVVATMLLLPVGAAGVSFVQVASRTVVYQRAEPGLIAQVFATQSGIGSVAALLPIIVSGVLLDLLPVRVVLGLLALLLAVAAPVASLRFGRRRAGAASPP